MSTEKKFKTFADLRLIPRAADSTPKSNPEKPEQTSKQINSAPSISSAINTPGAIKTENKSVENTGQPVSPLKDFQKVPNSVTREVLSLGLFRGKSKQVYDYLYSVTRGSINPTRLTRKSRKEIQKGSGIGSMVTVDAALAHLESIGLLKVRLAVGSLFGNEYEVFTPEETLNEEGSSTSIASISSYTSPIQILDILDIPLSSISSITQVVDNKETSADPKTFFKTREEIDDEPAAVFRAFNEKFDEVFLELTGRKANKSDSEVLAAIGELLAAEILEAAGRTKMVSDAAKFSLTHLRRRLGVRTVNVESEKKAEKGTTAKSIKREIALTDDEIQKCPDCKGRLVVYPAGPGKGAVMCKHQPLIKAKQETSTK